jgi:Zn-dependent peptidase ImmA (M78 family)
MTVAGVRTAAARFVDRLEIARAPVDVEGVARAIGLRVVREALDPSITGALLFTPIGPAACLNSRQIDSRQRLLLAHLIGHLQLRHRFPAGTLIHVDRDFEAYRDERRYSASERLDFEANVFAGSLVMPTRLIRQQIAALGARPLTDEDIQRLARLFGVSVQGMTLRLSRAGLF